ncbi:MAG: PKD domain-containing protein [Flavipsychrobacter sp.]|nr:PKD domain-containing protein [Flavipsychrobacter sp.]
MKQLLFKLCIGILTCLSLPALAQPVASFTASPVSGCAPLVVQFNNTSTGATSYSWNLGNTVTTTQQNPSTTYTTPGTYTVTLTASNGTQTNTYTATSYITVYPKPTVNFVVSDSGYSCPPKTVTFTNLSVPGGTGTPSYYWDFGNGQFSTQANPTVTYNTSGNFNVSLVVTNSFNCSQTFVKNNYVHTYPKPTAAFTSNNNNNCSVPATVNFTNNSSGATSYQWSFGNGNTSTLQNPSCTYTSAGTYTVRLIAINANGCRDTLIMNNYVNVGNVDAQFTSPSTVCVNNTINFTNTSTPGPGTSTWYFGNGNSFVGANASYAYTTPGTYNVKLVVVSNGCSDSVIHPVVVTPGPTANFTATPVSGCVPLNVQFTNTSTGANGYTWYFGNGQTSTATNPLHTYTVPNNTYTVTLVATSNSGCIDTQVNTQYITTISPIVIVTALPQSGCAPFTTNFSAQGVNVTLATYNWSFGDATPNSTQASPAHTYVNPGSYTATLTYTATNGCTGTVNYLIQVGVSPNANFTWNPSVVCPNQPVTFTNLSTGPVGTTYTWLFGDGSAPNSQTNPTYAYTQSVGWHTVKLIASSNGCSDTMTVNNAINVQLPLANFTFSLNCSNKFLINFSNQSQGNSTNLWNFGDGTPTSTLTNPSHTYTMPGLYNVKLTVTNSTTGCTDSVTIPVRVFQDIANLGWTDTSICEMESIQLSATVNPFAMYTTYQYNWGDNTVPLTLFLPGLTQPHIYTTAGNYVASLVVTDVYNCKDTAYQAIHVGGPVPNFVGGPTSGCAPLTVNFQDFSATNGSTIVSRYWVFGDGGTLGGNIANPSHVYTSGGTFSVKLVVTDAVGCPDSMTIPNMITVTKPTASFYSPDTITCPGQPVSFINNSTGTGNLTYAWTFGDGGTSTQTNPSHTYTSNGNFTVRLIVTDGNGCKDTLIRTNYIHSASMGISFTMSNDFATCPPLAVNFTNTSSGSVSAFTWDFGNGSSSNLTNPSALYTLPGVYVVTLTGQSTSGCTLTTTDTVTVLGPTANISYSTTSGCAPLTVTLNSNAQGANTITWDFNDGVTQTTTSNSVTHTYTQVGTFIPLLILSNGQGCNVTFQGDTIITGNLDASFTYAPATVCQGGAVQFTDTVIGNTTGLTHQWLFGDGGTSTAHNPQHVYATAGTYTVKLVMGNFTGCLDTATQTIVVNPLPNTNAGPNMAICAGQNASVQLLATGAQSYTWTPPTGLSCTNCANPVATPSVTTSYIVTGTSAQGCQKKDTIVVNVATPPVVSASNNVSICQGASTTLQALGGNTYQWLGNNLSCTNCPNPVASPTATTTYSVIGTNLAGCSDTAYVTVTVNPAPTVQLPPNQVICPGASVSLQATGANSYSWTPSGGLSCANCPNPVASPTATTTYVVTGYSTNGCPDTAHVTVTISLPPVSAGPDAAVCDGFSAQLQASGAVSYTWAPPTGLSCTNCPNPTVNVNTTTTYTVTGTDTLGCIATDQVLVTIGSIPNVSAGNDQVICEGDALPLQATGANTYVWTPATNLSCTNCANPTATPSATITYQVLGTNLSGCSDSASITVTVNPAPVVDAGADQTLCENTPAQLQASGAVSYAWSPGTGLSCTACDNPIATPSATTTYTVTGTGTNGCTATDDVVVNIVPAPPVNAGDDATICFGNSLQLQATGADTYVWTPGTDLTCTNCPDPLATPQSDITYAVTGTDANGCTATDNIQITVLQRQPITVSDNDSICVGESTVLTATGGDTYLWLPPDGLDNNQLATPTATPQNTTTYMAIVNQQGCFADTSYVTVTVSHPPTVNLGPDQTIVAGGSIQLNAEGSDIFSYAWNNGETLTCTDCKDPVATPVAPTLYVVTVSNEFGCESRDDINISLKCDGSQAFIPNTFTPNSDFVNDKFFVSSKGIRVITRFAIYNRWGELVFDAQNIPPNSPNHGWDGTFKGKPLEPDVFVYMIEAICDLGDVLKYKGDISLIR